MFDHLIALNDVPATSSIKHRSLYKCALFKVGSDLSGAQPAHTLSLETSLHLTVPMLKLLKISNLPIPLLSDLIAITVVYLVTWFHKVLKN